jgi:hypothetical protein
MASDRILAIDSTWDDNTREATAYRYTNVYGYLNAHGYPIHQLTGDHANEAEATIGAEVPSIVYITGVSHGTPDCFSGDQDRRVFQVGHYDPDAVKGKIVHFLSCYTAQYLGRDLTDPSVGAAAFFGYAGKFAWPAEGGNDYAGIFFDCDAEIDRALVDGATAAEAGQRAVTKFDAAIAALKAMGDDESHRVAAMLEWNRDNLCGPHCGAEYGSGDAKLSSL